MVIFDSVKHTYTNPETNKIYISVSQLLKKYKEPFDSDFFASKIAKRDGLANSVNSGLDEIESLTEPLRNHTELDTFYNS